MQTNIRQGGGTLNKTPLKKIKKMNIIIFVLVGISLFSLTTFTSYALFTNEAEGSNNISLTVSTAGRISIRIFEQNTGTEDVTLSSHQNIIKFDVKDGLVMDSFSCKTNGGETYEATYNKATDILTINNATQSGNCEINYAAGNKTLYDVITNETLKENSGLHITYDTQDKKASYYYRGEVNNNYVKFANQIWRIVRTNTDGSIRLILQDGINNNTLYKFNSYSGLETWDQGTFPYSYYSGKDGTPSDAKNTLETWYNNNLKAYENMIVTSEYCEAIKVVANTHEAGGSTQEFTAGNAYIIQEQDYAPSLSCPTDKNGKGKLNLKIGLLTIDELYLAGYTRTSNSEVPPYLHNSRNFWTMSPAGYTSWYSATEWFAHTSIFINYVNITQTSVLRPVISVTKTSKISTGNGTASKPYEIFI